MLASLLSEQGRLLAGARNGKGQSPLHCCAENPYPPVCAKCGDVVMYVLRGAETTAELLIRAQPDLVQQLDREGRTAAEVARGVLAAWGEAGQDVRGEYEAAREAGYTESFILDVLEGDRAGEEEEEVVAGHLQEENGGRQGEEKVRMAAGTEEVLQQVPSGKRLSVTDVASEWAQKSTVGKLFNPQGGPEAVAAPLGAGRAAPLPPPQ